MLAEWAVLLAAVGYIAWSVAAPRPYGDLAMSRLATVYSLTEYGTFVIESNQRGLENPFSGTVDKAMIGGEPMGDGVAGGELISTKPPVFPLIMTAEYLALHVLMGWDLDNPDDVPKVLQTMRVTLVGAAYFLALWFFRKTLALAGFRAAARVFLLVALAFGSQLWGYSTLINNHVPAAGLMMVALYLAFGLGTGKLAPAPWRFALFGLSSGLVVTIDMPAGIYPFMAALYLLWKHPGRLMLWGAPFAAIPIATHAGVMLALTGSPLPVQMHKEFYLFESSYWRHPMGIDGLSEPKGVYLFHMTLGRCGTFLLFPVLTLGLLAGVSAVFKRGLGWRAHVFAGFAGFVILTTYYVFGTNNYGGEAYGFRWHIASMPVLLLIAAPLVARARRKWTWALMLALLGVSIYSGWECTAVEWQSGQEWTRHLFGPAV